MAGQQQDCVDEKYMALHETAQYITWAQFIQNIMTSRYYNIFHWFGLWLSWFCFVLQSRTHDYIYIYVIQRCQPKNNYRRLRSFHLFNFWILTTYSSFPVSRTKNVCFPKLARISGKKILLEIRSPNERVGIFTHCRSVYGYINYVYNKQWMALCSSLVLEFNKLIQQ